MPPVINPKAILIQVLTKIPDIYNGPTMITTLMVIMSMGDSLPPKWVTLIFFLSKMVKILHIAIIFWIIVLIGYLFYQALKILRSK